MRIPIDVSFQVRGEDARALTADALAKLEQLNHGPLPAGVPVRVDNVGPELFSDGRVRQWRAWASCAWDVDVDYEGAPDVAALARELCDAIAEELAADGAPVPSERLRKAYAGLSRVVPGGLGGG